MAILLRQSLRLIWNGMAVLSFIHRIASYPDAHGIFSSIMEFCFSNDENIRIDTHRDNKIMQHNILKHGFTYCGIIYLLSGDERLAYQKVVNR